MRGIVGVICVMVLAAIGVAAQETSAKPMQRKGAAKIESAAKAAKPEATMSPYNGTWKFIPAKSHFGGGSQGLKAMTVNVQSTAAKFDWTATGEDSSGHAMDLAYHGAIDGKPHPLAGDPNTATISYQRGANDVLDATWKDAKGNVFGTQHMVLSADKKTITLTGKFHGADGKTATSTEVYEKAEGATNAAKKAPAKK